jgi:hypothetical protein
MIGANAIVSGLEPFDAPAYYRAARREPDGKIPGGVPAPAREPAPAAVRTRGDEGADSYPAVVAVLNVRWRVIECRNCIQWILQARKDRSGRPWRGDSYCTARAALLRCIAERAGACDSDALQQIAAFPDSIRRGS